MKEYGNALDFWIATVFFVIVMVIGIIDVIAVLSGGALPSVSDRLYLWSQRFPILPFLIGIVIGHLFFPLHPRPVP